MTRDMRLKIASELIDALARMPCKTRATSPDPEKQAVRRIIEAARACYVLPSFCAEMNSEASKCILCIVEHDTPKVCRTKTDLLQVDDLDIEWNND